MAEMTEKKKRLPTNLSFLTLNDPTKKTSAHKSPKNFEEPNGVVGLGILAALNDDDYHQQDPVLINGGRTAVRAISPKFSSNTIPMLSNKNISKNNSTAKPGVEEMELCEEYTCVISHVGENHIKKREYFEVGLLGNNNESQGVSVVTENSGGFQAVSDSSVSGGGGEAATLGFADFLNSCSLCGKMLHGLDIFMYRGEKAFCSPECRYRQMSMDEQKEKCRSGVRKSTEYSVSPRSGALQFSAGVAAA